jgi:hypothetical protein
MDHITWNKTANTTWETRAHRVGDYTGTIEYTPGLNPYELTISGGGGVSTHATLRNAKNHYRKFLFTKSATVPPPEE